MELLQLLESLGIWVESGFLFTGAHLAFIMVMAFFAFLVVFSARRVLDLSRTWKERGVILLLLLFTAGLLAATYYGSEEAKDLSLSLATSIASAAFFLMIVDDVMRGSSSAKSDQADAGKMATIQHQLDSVLSKLEAMEQSHTTPITVELDLRIVKLKLRIMKIDQHSPESSEEK